MRLSWPLFALGFACSGCASDRPEDREILKSKEAELAMKDRKIALLEKMTEKQHAMIEELSRKVKERPEKAADPAPQDERLDALERDISHLKIQTKNQNELHAHLYNELVNKFQQLHVKAADLEKRLSEKEKK